MPKIWTILGIVSAINYTVKDANMYAALAACMQQNKD